MPIFFDRETAFKLRQVSRSAQALIRHHQSGPYKTKQEFVLAVSGIFKSDKKLNRAWDNYYYTDQAFINDYAYLYKLSDTEKYFFIKNIVTNQDELEQGSVYCPGIIKNISNHCLPLNEVWIVAQIHAKRSFILLSPLSHSNIKRKKHTTDYSAFTRECVMAIKAGYVVKVSYGCVMLTPPEGEDLYHFNAENLSLDDNDIQRAIKMIQPYTPDNYIDGLKDVVILNDDPMMSDSEDEASFDVKSNITIQINSETTSQDLTDQDKLHAIRIANRFASIFSRLAANTSYEALKVGKDNVDIFINKLIKELYFGRHNKETVFLKFVERLKELRKTGTFPDLLNNYLDNPSRAELVQTLIDAVEEVVNDKVQLLKKSKTNVCK